MLDFTFDDNDPEADINEVVQTIQLRDKNGKVFYEKLTYIYLEMPHFKKKEDQLETRLDKWLYFIKHLEDFQSIPEIFKNDVVFLSSFQTAEMAKFDEQERESYEYSLKIYRDMYNVIDYGYKKGRAEGEFEKERYAAEQRMKEKIEVAKKGMENGLGIEMIVKITGLTEEDIRNLIQ